MTHSASNTNHPNWIIQVSWWVAITLAGICLAVPAHTRPQASAKLSIIRENNPKGAKEILLIPYALNTDSLGATLGLGGGVKGYGQDQLVIGGTLFGSSDDAVAGAVGIWDFRIPASERLFFSLMGSVGYYPRSRAYSSVTFDPEDPRPGGNDSDKDDYIEEPGYDNWTEFKLEYSLPLGAARNKSMPDFRLKYGMRQSPPSGGKIWNPLTSGISVLMLRQFNRYMTFEEEVGDIEGIVRPWQLGLLYDNTDFPTNPSFGSSQYAALTRDFAWQDSNRTWTFVETEISKYFSLGSSDKARQRVVALNFWTGTSPSWEEEELNTGTIRVNHRPPYFEGATLGGLYRMRAYPPSRFNDRCVIYTTAEYRYTPEWNPLGSITWLNFLSMDWWQFVAFAESGRVANTYSASELTSDWKADVGGAVRAMVAGSVVRLGIAFSPEGSGVNAMMGMPF